MELEILRFINEHFHSSAFFNGLFRTITYFGEHGIFAVGVCLALVAFKRPRKKGLYALAALAAEYVAANLILKPAVSRVRPFVADGDILEFLRSINCPIPADASFPSGHTGIMFAFAFALYFAYGRKAAPVFILSGFVALSRLFLCVHYPTDVLGGILVGYLAAAAVRYLPQLNDVGFAAHNKKLLSEFNKTAVYGGESGD